MSVILTTDQAYLAMFRFLEDEYRLSKSDDIAALLGDLSFAPDGKPCDPAVLEQWQESVKSAISGQIDNRRMSPDGVAF